MLFVEMRFFVFFLIVASVYWAMRSNRARKVWLLACSYVFYGAWDWRFLSLIFVSTLLDYVVGLKLSVHTEPRRRWLWMMASVAGNLGMLGVFKYFNFFSDSLVDLGNLLGFTLSRTTLDVILPAGISFYTFQTMSYSLDIYFGKLKASRSALDVFLFVAFFPQLVAGPILRAADSLPQLTSSRTFPRDKARAYLTLILVGFFKKACVADNLAPWVDAYFDDPGAYDVASSWIAVIFYAAQIYCDFSGYSDMAIGLAGLLGYEMMVNFASPYLSGSITEFWRRWHISLSSWLKDYLYIPLGGNRGTKLFTYRNLMLTMLLGGLWHGASWNFVLWGGLHGVALIGHKEWCAMTARMDAVRKAAHHLGPALTFYWVCVTWIFFRAVGLERAIQVFRSFVLLQPQGTSRLAVDGATILLTLLLLHWLAYRKTLDSWWRSAPLPVFSAAYGACFAVAVSLVPMGHRPFIYFQF